MNRSFLCPGRLSGHPSPPPTGTWLFANKACETTQYYDNDCRDWMLLTHLPATIKFHKREAARVEKDPSVFKRWRLTLPFFREEFDYPSDPDWTESCLRSFSPFHLPWHIACSFILSYSFIHPLSSPCYSLSLFLSRSLTRSLARSLSLSLW
jgi:hypothetical protein